MFNLIGTHWSFLLGQVVASPPQSGLGPQWEQKVEGQILSDFPVLVQPCQGGMRCILWQGGSLEGRLFSFDTYLVQSFRIVQIQTGGSGNTWLEEQLSFFVSLIFFFNGL